MAMNLNQTRGVTPVMNVTPLVDVVLVLLIIFMVVTPLLSKTFWLNLPKKDDTQKAETPPPPDPSNTPIVLTVDKAGVMRINQTEVPKAELPNRVSRMLAAQRQKVVYFDAKDDAPYAFAVEAMDLARSGGASTIAVMTENASR
jgi:biopolymer transport protein ExbD/biopolymer transport protein TolR